MPGDALLLRGAAIVGLPVRRAAAHEGLHRGDEGGRPGIEEPRGRIEPVEAFPERKGQRRPDLEDREAVVDEGAEAGDGLVVGRMRLEDEAGKLVEAGAERPRLLRTVGRDVGAAELDAGLDDEGDHPLAGMADACGPEGLAMQRHGPERRLRPRDLQGVDHLVRASGRRHLGADDVERRRAGRGCRVLGRRGEARGPGGDRRLRQGDRVVRAGHARVEMELRESRRDIGGDHPLALAHRLLGRARAPRIGAEMVAAEEHLPSRHRRLRREGGDVAGEVRRSPAGVAAAVIDLVAGRLDQHRRAGPGRLAEGCLEHEGIGRADGGDAPPSAGLVPLRQPRERARPRHGVPSYPTRARRGRTFSGGVWRTSQERT